MTRGKTLSGHLLPRLPLSGAEGGPLCGHPGPGRGGGAMSSSPPTPQQSLLLQFLDLISSSGRRDPKSIEQPILLKEG